MLDSSLVLCVVGWCKFCVFSSIFYLKIRKLIISYPYKSWVVWIIANDIYLNDRQLWVGGGGGGVGVRVGIFAALALSL